MNLEIPSPYFWLANFAFALLLAGFLLRKRDRRVHAGLMATGMAIDLVLVLVLEFSKGAVDTVLSEKLTAPQYLHVGTSTAAVILYFPVFALGWRRLWRPGSAPELKAWHMRLGYAALSFRILGFLFLFSMLSRQ